MRWTEPSNDGQEIVVVTPYKLFIIYINPYIIRCLLYTSPSPRDRQKSRMPSSA